MFIAYYCVTEIVSTKKFFSKILTLAPHWILHPQSTADRIDQVATHASFSGPLATVGCIMILLSCGMAMSYQARFYNKCLSMNIFFIYRVTVVIAKLDWVDFDVPSLCLTTKPILPNSNLPQQMLAESGTSRFKSTQPRLATTSVSLKNNPPFH